MWSNFDSCALWTPELHTPTHSAALFWGGYVCWCVLAAIFGGRRRRRESTRKQKREPVKTQNGGHRNNNKTPKQKQQQRHIVEVCPWLFLLLAPLLQQHQKQQQQLQQQQLQQVSAVNKTCGSCVQHLGRTAAAQSLANRSIPIRVQLFQVGAKWVGAVEILLPTFWGGGVESLSWVNYCKTQTNTSPHKSRMWVVKCKATERRGV